MGWIVIITCFVVFVYVIPMVFKKVGNILSKNVYGHYFKTFLKIFLVWGFIFIVHNNGQNEVYEETLTCSKITDLCTYSINTYQNRKFVEKSTFPLSSIKSIKTRTYKTKHHRRRGRIRYHTNYAIDLYKNAEEHFQYPIIPTDYDDLEHRFRKFTSFIDNDIETDYYDTKNNKIDEIFNILYLLGVLLSIVIIGIDINRWKKLQSEKFTPQEKNAIENIINEYKQEIKRPLREDEINTIVSSVRYWRQHQGHSTLMRGAVSQLFSTGQGNFNLILDSIIWRHWKILYPEDYEKDELSKIKP